METTLRRILEMYCQNTVEVEEHVWDTLQLQGKPEVTPDFINRSHEQLTYSFFFINMDGFMQKNLPRTFFSKFQLKYIFVLISTDKTNINAIN